MIRRDPGVNFVISKHTKVCSEHFTSDDFVDPLPELPPLRARLQSHAVPSVFSWLAEAPKRKSLTSMKAVAPLQECSSLLECSSGTEQRLAELSIDDNPCNEEVCHENDRDMAVLDHEDEIQ